MSYNFIKRLADISRRIYLIAVFILFYTRELIVASLLLTRDIFSPGLSFSHGIVKIEIDLKSDLALLAFINLLSMTPGSLTLDLSSDRKFVYIHSMYLRDIERFKHDVKVKFEQRIKAIFE